ncbi:hypothetical protein K402DRAFT_462601 [Aulographum hederae CBS 113979]|uniref:Uncharacterized protein n=1 Tax=Aulographum hederae CBS 113979 TaxID=1176131 RepID=A0A6G1H436_9PEZI|nr:hypothetical protein K402DRAFT_462601 [Aulographum hederae CBS 113979]
MRETMRTNKGADKKKLAASNNQPHSRRGPNTDPPTSHGVPAPHSTNNPASDNTLPHHHTTTAPRPVSPEAVHGARAAALLLEKITRGDDMKKYLAKRAKAAAGDRIPLQDRTLRRPEPLVRPSQLTPEVDFAPAAEQDGTLPIFQVGGSSAANNRRHKPSAKKPGVPNDPSKCQSDWRRYFNPASYRLPKPIPRADAQKQMPADPLILSEPRLGDSNVIPKTSGAAKALDDFRQIAATGPDSDARVALHLFNSHMERRSKSHEAAEEVKKLAELNAAAQEAQTERELTEATMAAKNLAEYRDFMEGEQAKKDVDAWIGGSIKEKKPLFEGEELSQEPETAQGSFQQGASKALSGSGGFDRPYPERPRKTLAPTAPATVKASGPELNPEQYEVFDPPTLYYPIPSALAASNHLVTKQAGKTAMSSKSPYVKAALQRLKEWKDHSLEAANILHGAKPARKTKAIVDGLQGSGGKPVLVSPNASQTNVSHDAGKWEGVILPPPPPIPGHASADEDENPSRRFQGRDRLPSWKQSGLDAVAEDEELAQIREQEQRIAEAVWRTQQAESQYDVEPEGKIKAKGRAIDLPPQPAVVEEDDEEVDEPGPLLSMGETPQPDLGMFDPKNDETVAEEVGNRKRSDSTHTTSSGQTTWSKIMNPPDNYIVRGPVASPMPRMPTKKELKEKEKAAEKSAKEKEKAAKREATKKAAKPTKEEARHAMADRFAKSFNSSMIPSLPKVGLDDFYIPGTGQSKVRKAPESSMGSFACAGVNNPEVLQSPQAQSRSSYVPPPRRGSVGYSSDVAAKYATMGIDVGNLGRGSSKLPSKVVPQEVPMSKEDEKLHRLAREYSALIGSPSFSESGESGEGSPSGPAETRHAKRAQDSPPNEWTRQERNHNANQWKREAEQKKGSKLFLFPEDEEKAKKDGKGEKKDKGKDEQ